jgi:hypothetical protein
MLTAVWKVATAIWGGAGLLGRLWSIMSLVALLTIAFRTSLFIPLQLMLEWYLEAADFFLGRFDPLLKTVMEYLGGWLAVDIRLYPHWKHILVPMWLYFSVDAKAMWISERKLFSIFTVVWGGLVAWVASVASGTSPLDDPNMLPMIFPAAGFVLYAFVIATWSAVSRTFEGYTRWQVFRYYVIVFPVGNAIIACAVIFLGFYARSFIPIGLNVVLMILFIVGMALRNILVSAVLATFSSTTFYGTKPDTWIERFRS